MSEMTNLPPIFGVLGLVCAFVIYVVMTRYDEGGEKIRKIGNAIHEGAMVFMHLEYRMLALFTLPLFIILYYFLGQNAALAFAVGALS